MCIRKVFLFVLLFHFVCSSFAQEPKLVLPVGHTGRINSADFSPDGKFIATASDDKTAKIWDIRSGKELHTLYGHTKNVTSAKFSSDGKRITTISNDNTIRIWDVASSNLLQTLEADEDRVAFSELSPDGKYFLIIQKSTNTNRSKVDIWDIVSGKLLYTLEDSTMNDIHSLDFSQDSKYILTQNDAANTMMWEISSAKLLHSFKMKYVSKWTNGNSKGISSVKFSPDGKLIINLLDVETRLYNSEKKDRSADIWDVAMNTLLYTLDDVCSARFSPDGKFILTYSFNDGTAQLRDAFSGNIIASFGEATELVEDITIGSTYRTLKDGYSDWINSAQYSPDGHIVTISNYDTAKIWDADEGKLLYTLERVRSLQYIPDGKFIVTACWDSTAKVWDIASGKLLQSLNAAKGDFICDVYSAQFAADGQNVITESNDGVVKIWDAVSGKLILSLKNYDNSGVQSVKFSSDNKKIVTASRDNTIKIWDAASGELLQLFQGHTALVELAKFSYGGKYLLASFPDTTTKVWEVASGKLLHILKGYATLYDMASFSPDGKYVVTGYKYGESIPKIWDISSGRLLYTLKVDTGLITSSEFSSDGKYIITTSNIDRTAKIWGVESGKLLHTLKNVRNIYISPDGKRIATISKEDDSATKIWDVASGKLLYTVEGHPGYAYNETFSPDGKYIVTSNDDYEVKIMDAASGKLLHTLREITQFRFDGTKMLTTSSDFTPTNIWDIASGKLLHTIEEAALVKFSPNGNYIFTTDFGRFNFSASKSNTAKILDAASGKLLHILKDNSGWVESGEFSPDSKNIITVSNDFQAKIWHIQTGLLEKTISLGENTVVENIDFANDKLLGKNNSEIRVFNLSTGKLLYSVISTNGTDYLSRLPNGYYMATQNASKLLHYVTKDLKVISFEQLDVKYNRPDKVLEAIGNTDTALINSFRKAWEKRIKKLGIDTTQFRDGYSVPEADFINRDNIEYEQKNGTLQFHISGVDSTYKLDRFNIWVNEAPLFGQRGISIKHQNKNNLDTIITIQLSHGENRIETSITNVNGTESYRMPLYVNYTPAVQQKEMAHFIGIGIDKFADNKFNLQYSSKDIRDLAIKLKEKYKDNIIIDTLFNENVTTTNVKKLKEKLLTTSVNDKVIVSYSGHGLLSKDYDYYLSTYAVNFNKPEENGLPYDELENLLDSIPARKKLMLIDACHSGEVDKEEMQRYAQSANKLDTGVKGAIKLELNKSAKLGMKNSFELMQNLFVNVGKSTGATIISAAAGTQFALERSDLKNGVFTYCILEEMKKNKPTTISQLKKTVGEQVEKMTKGLQKPTSRNENVAVDWNLW
jgi:WD40 repeat protein